MNRPPTERLRRPAPPRLGRRLIAGTAALCAVWSIALYAVAGETLRVGQKGRAFQIKTMTIAIGDLVVFANNDEFIHQIFVESAAFNFDSPESLPGDAIDLKFTESGTFAVHCHIHPKMELIVSVK